MGTRTRRPPAHDEAELWHLDPGSFTDPDRLRGFERLLTDDEVVRMNRFRFAEGRHQFLLTRALVRTVLSHYTGVPPEAWRFEAGPHGRPQISEPTNVAAPCFNLSHTKGLIVCLVAHEREIGVDVESIRRSPGRMIDVARRHFSESESAALLALPEAEQRNRFFEYWTLKESFIKALGVGISFGLSRFSFRLDGDEPRISFDPGVAQDPAEWQFGLSRYGPNHLLATSIRREPAETVRVVLRQGLSGS